MKVLDPGHRYELQTYDGSYHQELRFMKRVGPGYPGNEPPPYGGTNCQEVLRVLIDRVKYLQNQDPDPCNQHIIDRLRTCIWLFEDRAERRREGHIVELFNRVHQWANDREIHRIAIDEVPVCQTCGHVLCVSHALGPG